VEEQLAAVLGARALLNPSPGTRSVKVVFPCALHASHAKAAIDVDEELQPDKVCRVIAVDGCVMNM
jgi:uncharacterized metal-binding protein